MASTPTVAFYFDPISPYSWLAGLQVGRLDAAGIALDFRPVLFAGLLAAHGNKGPAEIPAKRAYTFRDVMRQALSLGARAEGPPAHPFNPLRALRMCIALDDGAARRRFGLALMDAAWARGLDLAAPEQLVRIADENGLDGAALSQRADDPGVKERLAAQTSAATAAGIFGVPTFVCADEIFWGADRIDAVLRRAAGHAIDEAELAAKLARPASAVRKA
jgi:2-hydroxychromene-2-carboxylate isomerase